MTEVCTKSSCPIVPEREAVFAVSPLVLVIPAVDAHGHMSDKAFGTSVFEEEALTGLRHDQGQVGGNAGVTACQGN